jgi:hypothetical protein
MDFRPMQFQFVSEFSHDHDAIARRAAGPKCSGLLRRVVIGGLVTSTLLTLFVLPTLYAWLGSRRLVW